MRALPLALAAVALSALFAGCVQPDVESPIPAVVSSLYPVPEVPVVDAKALLADHAIFVTKNGERAANVATHESARVDLLDRFASYGLETYRQNFTTDIDQANIIGIKWGVVRDQWVVVGGHYDTTTDDCLTSGVGPVENPCALRQLSQGAYDDGSGTFMAVHLAKAFSQIQPYYTIAFVGFDGEERGTEGATAFVNEFAIEQSTPYGDVTIVGAVDLDMVGINWPGTMAPMNILTNSEAAYKVADDKRVEMGWPDEQWIRKDGLRLGSSDYARFWEISDPAPIPTIFFISDFEEVGAPAPAPGTAYSPGGAYPFWHLQDTVETMTAMAGGEANLEAGFQAAVDVASTVVHAMSSQPELEFDAVAK